MQLASEVGGVSVSELKRRYAELALQNAAGSCRLTPLAARHSPQTSLEAGPRYQPLGSPAPTVRVPLQPGREHQLIERTLRNSDECRNLLLLRWLELMAVEI